MMKYRQVLSGAVLAGALALPAAELVRVDFSREDAAQPPRSTGYVPGEVIDLPTGLPEQGAQIVSGALELAFPASSSDAVSAWFGAWNLESSGRVGIAFDLTVAAYRAPSDGRPETVLSAQLLGDQGRNIGMLTFVSEGPEKGIIQWNPASGAPERFGAYRVGETYSFQINYDPASGAVEVTRQGGKTVRSAGAGALPFRQFRIGSGWAVGGRDGAATVRVGKVAVRDAAKGGKAALPKVTAGPKTPPGIGEWDGRTLQAELKGPYEDRLQQQIPFGCTSYYLTPWRAYMDTHPASRFGRIQAVNWSDLSAPESEATMRLLAEAGFRSFRLEIGWGHFDFDDESQLSAREVERLKLVLPLAKKYKLRPMILLNAHSGGPCPRRTVPVELAAAAPAGARELRLKGGFAPFRTGRTGLNNQEQWVAFPLITGLAPQPDGTVLAQLSAPLNRAVPAGKAELTELKYAPFSGDVLEDGTPNPEARETVDGWCRYVKHVTCAVRDILDSGDPEDAGFDVEVWNEYSFGSQFVWERNYYRPARKFRSYPAYAIAGKTTADAEVQAEIVLPLTIELVNDPAMRLPGVRVVSGFSNQRPWDNGSEMWPGQAGFSRHYYTNLDCSDTWHDSTGYLSAATENPDRLRRPPLDAQGKPGKGFVPELRFSLPESPCFGIKTEFMIRDMQPFPGPWAHHHRFSHPGTGKPALLWETEFNTYRRPFAELLEKAYGVKRGDPRLQPVLQAVAAKALVRSFVFYCHKGIDTLFVFAVRNGEDEFSILPEAYFRALARNRYQLNDEVRRAAGPQIAAASNLNRLLGGAKPLESTRRLTVRKLVEHRPRLVFRGDGTAAAPDRFHRDDFACLPFQLDASSYAVGFYVVTRDLLHGWNPQLDLLDPRRYEMPEQRFDLTLGNLNGIGAKLEIYDPILDRTFPVRPLAASGDALTVPLPTVDYPRFLIVREKEAGPLVGAPELKRTGPDSAELAFTPNVSGQAEISWGAFPERRGGGSVTVSAEAGRRRTVELNGFRPEYGVRIVLRAGKLAAVWPQWDHDVAGVLEFRQTGGNIAKPERTAFLPDFAPEARRIAAVKPDSSWERDGEGFRRGGARLYRVPGGAEETAALLPVIARSDRRNAAMVEFGGIPAWLVVYDLDPTMHPDRKNHAFSYLILPGSNGSWIVEVPEKSDRKIMEALLKTVTLSENK